MQLVNYKIKTTYSSKFNYSVEFLAKKRIILNAKNVLNYIKKAIKNHRNLLDIGSGFGYFLKESEKVFDYSLGLEPSVNLYSFSRKILKTNVKKQTFQKFFKTNKNRRFDVITMIHVIEHVKDPESFILKALGLLNRDGILFIETPNLNSRLFEAEQKDYTFLTPPEHLFIFSIDSFKEILNNINYVKIIKVSTYSYVEHSVKIINTFFKSFFNKNYSPSHIYNTPFVHDRGENVSIFKFRKYLFFVIFHRILGPIILPFVKLGHKGTFLRLYIKKI